MLILYGSKSTTFSPLEVNMYIYMYVISQRAVTLKSTGSWLAALARSVHQARVRLRGSSVVQQTRAEQVFCPSLVAGWVPRILR